VAELRAAWPFTRKKTGTARAAGFAHVLRTTAKAAPRSKKKGGKARKKRGREQDV
jgi:hypothetical protein